MPVRNSTKRANLVDPDTKKVIRALLESLVNWTLFLQRGRAAGA